MSGLVFFSFVCFLQYVAGSRQLCDNNTKELSCTTEILGENRTDYDMCRMKVYPADSPQCGSMSFGALASNTHVGGTTLKPYIMTTTMYSNINSPFNINHTVLNITFSNIKWKTMKFRFQNKNRESSMDMKNHCRKITISNDLPINDQSVLYYDCYWAKTDDRDGQSHILDFEATASDDTVNRGQYYFNIPSAEMLSPTTTEEKWRPFIYIEIFPSFMRLHIMPPPRQLKIKSYHIKVKNNSACDKDTCDVKSSTIPLQNNTDEVTYDYNFVGANGSFSFVVTPLHETCNGIGPGCQIVESPRITISSDAQTLNICIASITALIVATLFAYYIVLRAIRRYWCNDKYKLADMEIPTPPKILVIYSPVNRLHAECVASFITYLRVEYGFDIMYDGDICNTSHGDPYLWAEEAFRLATHVVYIVGPAEEVTPYNNIYDKPIISVHKDIDTLLLSFVKANRATRCPKDILNVFFKYSDGRVPVETRLTADFHLLKDWQKLISCLSKNLLTIKHITRTEKGRCFIEDLTRAQKLLNVKSDDVIVNCGKVKSFEKKILL